MNCVAGAQELLSLVSCVQIGRTVLLRQSEEFPGPPPTLEDQIKSNNQNVPIIKNRSTIISKIKSSIKSK